MRLNFTVAGQGPALLLLHGFTGSGSMWQPFLAAWRNFTSIAVDLPGHGASDSPPDPAVYRMERCTGWLVDLLDHLAVERAAVIGYSMGGRVALHLALTAPEKVSALVLESASPGIEDGEERRARQRSDRALANDIERDGVAAFVSRWETLPLFASQLKMTAEAKAGLRRQRLKNSTTGLANSLRGLGAGEVDPVWSRLGGINIPALIIAGELDKKYRMLASRTAQAMPNARAEVVGGAGHAVHLERPEVFAELVSSFLELHLSRE